MSCAGSRADETHASGAARPGRFAVVSHALPPDWSGQSTILYKLLRDMAPDRYVLVSSRAVAGAPEEGAYISRLPVEVHQLPRERSLARFSRFGLEGVLRPLEAASRIVARGLRIARIARRERCGALVACSGDLLDLPATFLASRLTGARFHAYLFDDYTFQWAEPRKRALAAWLEAWMLPRAAGVIAPNEFLRDAIWSRHGITPVIVRNAVEVGEPSGAAAPWPSGPGQVRVVYTGAVYHAHYDAFRNLVGALAKLGRPEVRLHIYTTQDPRQLEAEGISGPVTFHSHVPAAEARALQGRADVLFLPLAFTSEIPEVIRTSAPGKMGEYLASGRPVLVHAPADSFVSWYFRTHACGVVVDAPDAARLADGLREILDRPDFRRTLGEHARRRAVTDFALGPARSAFVALVAGGAEAP